MRFIENRRIALIVLVVCILCSIVLLGGGADTHDLLAWQVACGMTAISGTLSGVMVTEDELIRDGLLAER